MAPAWLLLVLALPPALPPALALPVGSRGAETPAGAGPALEAVAASGEGRVPRGELGALVASVSGRAQCPGEPCGACPSVPAVLALAGHSPGATAGLEAPELAWLGAALLATLRDPPGACGDPDGDPDGDPGPEATAGPWATRVRALHRQFTGNGTVTVTGNGTVTATSNVTVTARRGPGLREVAELLAAIEPNYRGDNCHQGCVDAPGVLAASARLSPRLGPGQVLVALGVLVLRGHCLCPGDTGDIRDIRDTGDIRDIGDTGDIRDIGDTGDIRDIRDIRDPRDTGDIRETGNIRDIRDTEDIRDPRDIGDIRDTEDTGDIKDTGDIRDIKDTGDIRDIKDRRDTLSPQCGDTDSHCGDSGDTDTHRGNTSTPHGDTDTPHGDTDTPHGDSNPTDTHCGDSNAPHGDTDTYHGDTGPTDTPRGVTETHHGPRATSPLSGDTDSGHHATVPTATNSTGATDQFSTVERYVEGTLTALALALLPLVALGLVRCRGCPGCPGCPRCPRCPQCLRRWGRPLLDGLAAGALSGDALLHVLPQALGLHSHSGESHSEGHGTPWELLAVLGGLYGGFVLERLLGDLGQPQEEDGDPNADPTRSTQNLHGHGAPRASLLVSVGGGLHRLADGLALGSAFATSGSAGAAAGAGLALHELPRALSDALVLSRSGLSPRRVLLLALAGAVPVVPGALVGLALGAAPAARSWLGALGGGLLLHLALCHMVPAMLSERARPPWVLLGVQSVGLLGGWGLLLLLALGEERGMQ